MPQWKAQLQAASRVSFLNIPKLDGYSAHWLGCIRLRFDTIQLNLFCAILPLAESILSYNRKNDRPDFSENLDI